MNNDVVKVQKPRTKKLAKKDFKVQLEKILQKALPEEDMQVPMERFLKAVLPKAKARVRSQICKYLISRLHGKTYRIAAEVSGVQWPTISSYCGIYPTFRELIRAIDDMYNTVRQKLRESEAERRAVEGWTEEIPVKHGTILVHKSSDRLMELLLKANDREKYGDRQEIEHKGGGMTVNIGIQTGTNATNPLLEQDKNSQAIDV